MDIYILGELVTSNNYFLLLLQSVDLINIYSNLGVYLQGIPTANVIDYFWGTNAGIRTIPILLFLTTLQFLFSTYTTYAYLSIAILLPFITFPLAYCIWRKPTLFTYIGAIFFGGNIWIIDRLYTGFWQLNIVYAFLPFLITIPLKVSERREMHSHTFHVYPVLYSTIISVIIISQPHFIIIAGIFSLSHLICISLNKQFNTLIKLLYFYGVTFILLLPINAYLLIPSLFYPEQLFTAPNQYFSLASVEFNGKMNFIHNILRFNNHHSIESFSPYNWVSILELIPFSLFIILFTLNKKRRYIFLILVFIFIYFAKGLNPPFENISRWIYQNIFFMHFFRDSSRFIAGMALICSLSIATFTTYRNINRKATLAIIALTFLLFFIINSQSHNKAKEIFKKTEIPISYINMQKYINMNLKNNEGQRLLILPNNHGVSGYSWYNNPSPISTPTIFGSVLPLSIPLANATNYPDSYSNQMSTYISTLFTKTYNPVYLQPLSVKYILVDNSIYSPQEEKNIATISASKLSNSKYTLLHQENNLSLYSIKTPGVIVSTDKPIFAVGNLQTIADLSQSGNMSPVILLNQTININNITLAEVRNYKIFIDTPYPELALTGEKLASDYSIDVLSAGWNYDQLFVNYEPYKMRDIKTTGELFTSGRSVSSSTKNKLMKIDHKLDSGKYILLIKALSRTKTTLEINIENMKINIDLDTRGHLLWKKSNTIRLSSSVNEITLNKYTNDQIILDHILFVPENKYNQNIAYFTKLLSSMEKYKQKNKINRNTPRYSSDKNYAVLLSNPSKHITYNLSYGKNWKTNEESSEFISNGYGMTFIGNNKMDKVIYNPSNIFHLSLYISVISILLSLVYIGYILICRIRINR